MLFKKKPVEIRAPINGKLTHLENVNDQVFSQKMLGDGIKKWETKLRLVMN
jgi:phosphotransferase system IIA component